MGIFFTSDQHYGHNNVISFCNRPFANVDEMTEELIRRHNAIVKSGDLIYHLGDMFWKSFSEAQALEVMDRLNGTHFYINGNHEEVMKSKKLRERFIWIRDIAKLHSTDISPRIILCHYAMLVWEGSHRQDWQLYGHSHGELSSGVPDAATAARLNSLDVGVDCWGYAPVSLEEVSAKIKQKQLTSGLTNHTCPTCKHGFYNYSKLETTCTKCLAKMLLEKP